MYAKFFSASFSKSGLIDAAYWVSGLWIFAILSFVSSNNISSGTLFCVNNQRCFASAVPVRMTSSAFNARLYSNFDILSVMKVIDSIGTNGGNLIPTVSKADFTAHQLLISPSPATKAMVGYINSCMIGLVTTFVLNLHGALFAISYISSVDFTTSSFLPIH